MSIQEYFLQGQVFAAIVAIVFGIVSQRMNFKNTQKRETLAYTLTLLTVPIHNTQYSSFSQTVYNLSLRRQLIQIDSERHERNISDKEELDVLSILNYFQMLAIAMQSGVIDRSLVMNYRGKQMAQFLALSELFINQYREILGRSLLFKEYEDLVKTQLYNDYAYHRDRLR